MTLWLIIIAAYIVFSAWILISLGKISKAPDEQDAEHGEKMSMQAYEDIEQMRAIKKQERGDS